MQNSAILVLFERSKGLLANESCNSAKSQSNNELNYLCEARQNGLNVITEKP